MTSITEVNNNDEILLKIGDSSDCCTSPTTLKNNAKGNYSSEELSEDDDTSSINSASFHSNVLQSRKRRNAIDFSPMDARNEEVCSTSSIECEALEQEIMEKSSSNSSLCTDESSEEKEPTENEIENPVVTEEIEVNLHNNSCSSIYETPLAQCSESSSYCDDDAFEEDLSQYKDASDKEITLVLDKKQYFWRKHRKSRQPLLSTDIYTNDMSLYYSFTKPCHCLCNLSIVPSIEISEKEKLCHSNASTSSHLLTAKQLLPHLECSFAYMHGGKDFNNAPIISFPHYPDLRNISDENFQDVILYLTSITSAKAADLGFVLVLDRRRDKWASLRAVLIRLASFFPGNLRMVLVLRPVGFFQATIADLGFRFRRDEFSMKVHMLSTLDELYTFVQPDELTQEFGGSYDYNHAAWIQNRMLIEDFSTHATDVGRSLDEYGLELAETELPNDVISTQTLIKIQRESTKSYKAKLERLQSEASELKETIRVPLNGSILPPCQHSIEIETLHNMASLVKETEIAFEKFWLKHQEKLQQCLQLRKFEQDYREARFKLTVFEQWFEHQNDSIGTSLTWLLNLIEETERLKESFAICDAECTKLASDGRILIENHYAVDCIAPKCAELLAISSNLADSFKERLNFLNDVRDVLSSVEDLNTWCDQAMSLLAGQTVEKALTVDGSKQMLRELDCFFGSDNIRSPIDSCLVPSSVESCVVTVNRRREEVEKLYGKCQSSLKKSVAKYTERPVQLVEPSKKQETSSEPSKKAEKKETSKVVRRKSKRAKPRVQMLSPPATPVRTPAICIQSAPSDSTDQLQHVMKELLSTERTYVEELKAIVEGYGESIDNEEYADIVPEKLKGNRRILLGNMEDIYRFHEKIFLTELEDCKNEPQLVGQCFINRKQEFGIYAKYCQNSANSEQLRAAIGEKHPFFIECQKKLGHRLALSAYLLKPVQRITKYQLLLQQMLKSSHTHTSELQDAVGTMLAVLKSVNDSMHQAAIVGFEGDLESLGQLLMQSPMQVEHKKNKSKNIARPRFNKTLHRHIFLFEKELLFCKLQTSDSNSENSAFSGNQSNCSTLGGAKGQHYVHKLSLKMNGAGITETVKGDNCKFEIWYQRREEVYSFLASSTQVKQEWIKAIKKVLSSQPPSDVLPDTLMPETTKSTKAKRSQSLSRKSRPASTSESLKESKKNPTLNRSSSMGKGKNRLIKRKNTNDMKKPSEKEDSLKEPTNSGITIKSASMSRLLDDPPSLSDVDEGFDSSTALTSESSLSGCRFVVMKERTENLNEDDLALRVGDVVQIIQSGKEGWVKVRIEQTGQEGWAPTTNIRSLSDASSFDSVCSYSSVC